VFAIDPTAIAIVLVLVSVVPLIFVLRASSRRKEAIAAGDLVLKEKTNTFAIISLIVVFFGAVPGIVFGHIALAQLKASSERGWGLAVAAVWIGYASIAAALVAFGIALIPILA
jgi:hypothetical protein